MKIALIKLIIIEGGIMGNLSEKTIKTIESEMNYWKIPGVSIAVIKDGKLMQSIGLGFRNAEENLPVTADTMFGIASCSKSMTSALISILVDKGVLNYDEPVTTYAPNLVMKDPAARNMTLRDILSHMTGFGTHDALWPGDTNRDDLAGRLRYINPCSDYRKEAIYSNVMYALAGYVAECATGETWDDLMKEYIFSPLGMERTNCSVEEMKKDLDYSLPYRVRNMKSCAVDLWNVDLAGPAASVNSTANDMARWLMMHIAGGKKEDGTVLIKSGTFKEMHTVLSSMEDSIGCGEGFYECSDYSMGWRRGYYKGHAFFKHTGKIEGFSSIQSFLPDDKAGVVILTNLHSPTVPFMYSSLYTILDEILGEESENWTEKFHGEELPKEEDYHDCELNYFTEEQIPGTQPTLPLENYEGTYHDDGYGNVKIIYENDNIYMLYRDMNICLKHYHKDVFRADDVLEDIYTISLPVSFQTENGAVKSVAVRFEEMVPDIIFTKL